MRLRGDERKVKVLEEICGVGTSEDHTDVTNSLYFKSKEFWDVSSR